MYEVDPARSEIVDLQGTGELYLRRQCSLLVLRIRFERAIVRLRLLAPDAGEALRGWMDRIDEIAQEPSGSQYPLAAGMLDDFARWGRGPLVPRPRPAPDPSPATSVLVAQRAPDPPPAPAPPPEPAPPDTAPPALAWVPDFDDVPHPLPDELDPDPDPEPPTVLRGRAL